MRYLIIILILLITSCSPEIYLSNVGYVSDFDSESVTVVFDCENVKRPDCAGYAKFDRSGFDSVYVNKKIIIK